MWAALLFLLHLAVIVYIAVVPGVKALRSGELTKEHAYVYVHLMYIYFRDRGGRGWDGPVVIVVKNMTCKSYTPDHPPTHRPTQRHRRRLQAGEQHLVRLPVPQLRRHGR